MPGSTAANVRATALEVLPGTRLDLHRQAIVSSPLADLEIARGPGGALIIRPGEGVMLSEVSRGPAEPGDVASWTVEVAERAERPRQVLMRQGDWLHFRGEHCGRGRLELETVDGRSGWWLRVLAASDDDPILPRPPGSAGSVTVEDGVLRLRPEPLQGLSPATRIQHVLEREETLGSRLWRPIPTYREGGDLMAALDPAAGGALPVARLRLRHGVAGGLLSEPGQAFDLLLGDAPAETLARDAIAALVEPAFQRRVEAHAILDLLGETARPALEGALESARMVDDRVLLEAARGRLGRLASTPEARASELLEAAHAAGAQAQGTVPAGLLDADPVRRASALLRLLDAREPAGSRPWAAALALHDGDPRVRALAGFLDAIVDHDLPFAPPAVGPAWLVPPASSEQTGFDLEFDPSLDPWDVAERPELADLTLGPAVARVLVALGAPEVETRAAALALELVDRALLTEAVTDRAALVAAVDALLPGDAAALAALRTVGDRRRAGPDEPEGRERIVLTRPSLLELRARLDELRERFDQRTPARQRWAGVDLVLPGGDYGEPSGDLVTLDVDISGVRLIGAGPGAVIHGGLRLRGAVGVVLQDLEVRNVNGQALTLLEGAHVVGIGARLKGHSRVVHAAPGILELHGSWVAPSQAKPSYGTIAQVMEGSLLVARSTEFRGGSFFVGQGGAEIRLDRCVVDAGERPFTQGQRGGRLVARESLFTSGGGGFMMLDEALLAGCVVDAGFQPFGRGAEQVRVSPVLFALTGSDEGASRLRRLDEEPLPRR